MAKLCQGIVAVALLLLGGQGVFAEIATAGPCDAPVDEIVCENSKVGNPATEWDIEGSGDPSIQGFTTDISVNHGQAVRFKIKTDATAYHLDIYRMGYYGGDGARKVASSILPSAKLPQSQPACKTEGSTGLFDCGNWSESASWTVPSTAVSGIYFAKLVRTDKSSEGSHVIFVVRNDESHSKLLFQTADSTWQAYNRYGGNSLYAGGPGTNPERAYKVSYNRPLTTRGTTPEDAPFSAEYPMVRWLERNGYDVSYFTSVDDARRGGEILEHEAFLSVGHDEYWSAEQRENVEAAREAGVNLAFFSGNEIFWKTRWENSIDGSSTGYRTIVCYKETHAGAKIDPKPNVWTGTWRDPRLSPPADGGKPENSLSGQAFMVNSGTGSIEVPAADAKLRLWRNTDVASLKAGETATLGTETLGYEWDEDLDNGARPPGLIDLSTTTFEVQDYLIDYGSNYLPGPATHHLTLYRAPSGALVFGAGTVQWSWGLDEEHDRGAYPRDPDSRMQQATVNLFADMGVQPTTLQEGIVAATQSTDTTPPVTTIANPADGSAIESGEEMTISGTASDVGGQVAGIEVSTDGGESWHPATGKTAWTYPWTPGETGSATIKARAADDSANLEKPGDQNSIEIVPRSCPCSIWDSSFTGEPETDPSEIEVGVKFRADTPGYITGLRFYKTPEGTGTHVGHLYTAGGAQMAEATFTKETSSGWQQVDLAKPVAINANTTYVASYYAPNGHYAALSNYFSVVGADSAPLHALADGVDGHNGVYHYGVDGTLFSGAGPESFQATNYMVDVVFESEEQPPVISNVQTVAHNDGTATVTWETDKASDSKVDYGTSSSSLGSSKSSSTQVTSHSIQLSGLAANTTHYFRVTSAAGVNTRTEPSPLLSPLSFITPPAAPTLTGTVPASPANNNSPKVVGSAASGTTVRLYGTSGCTGSPLVTASAAELAAGVSATVADDTSTTFRATATGSASEASACSAGLTYVEDSTAPQTQISSGPPTLSTSASAELKFSGTDTGGSGVASYECRIDSTEPGAWAACTSPKTYNSLADGAHKFEVRAIDTAGNADSSPAASNWTVDTTAPITQIDSGPSALSASGTANFKFSGTDTGGSGVASYECRIDSTEPGAWASCTSPKTYNSLADGAHKFEVRAIDTAGNADSSPAASNWTVDTTAPQVQIISEPASISSSAEATFAFSGTDIGGSGVASYQCRRDSEAPGAWEVCGSPETYNALAEGPHKFEVRAVDGAGNVTAPPATYAWTIDTVAPQTLIDSNPTAVTASTSANFSFSGSDTGGSGVASYECRIDSIEPGAWASCTSPKTYTGLADGAHKFEVRAIDTAGNADSSPATYAWTVDTTAPETQIDSNPVSLSASAKAEFGFGGNDGSGSGVASFQCRIDSTEAADWQPCASVKTYPALADGAHKFEVRASDQAGNTDQSPATYSWNIDTTAPQTQIDSGPAALVSSASAELEFSGTDTGGSGVASYECRIDSTEPSAWASCTSPKTYTGLADGAHKFEVRSIDTAGNIDTSPAASNWTVDTTAPITQIDSGPSALSASGTANFEFSGTDTGGSGVASYECRIDSTEPSAWASCTSPKTYTGLADGAHKFEVRAIDTAGNTDQSPATFSWTVDTTAPQTQIDSNPTAVTTSTSANFSFSGSDTGGSGVASYECRIDSTEPSAWTSCTSPKTYTSLADGAHKFEVRASDQAGNADQSPATFSWTIDTTAPDTQIDSGPAALVASANAELKFSGTDPGGSGVASYECRIDSTEPSAWASCTSPKTYNSLADGAHKFEVRAIDTAGNIDTSPAASNWTVDTTAPITQIDSGPSALSASGTAKFEFSGTDTGGSGVASYECRIDSTEPGAWASCTSPKTYNSLADGAHKFEVRAIDTAGNADSSPAASNWTVDTTAPDTQVDAGPSALSTSADAEFTFSGDDGSGSGVASYQCRRDSEEAKDWVPCGPPQTYPALADGAHKFEVRASDQAGNTDPSPAVFNWIIDATAPQTQIDAQPVVLSASPTAQFTFSGDDSSGSGVASYECRVDSTEAGGWAPCASPKTYNSLADGAHKFEVRAVDAAGNVDQSPASFSWTVDATAPDSQISSNPLLLSASPKAEFSFTGSDGSGSGVASYECRLDSTQSIDWKACASTKEYTGLVDGAHKFEVRAIDQFGNVDQSPATFSWTIDTTAPQTQIDSGPSALSASGTPKFEFSGTDTGGSGVASYECRIDSTEPSAWASCTSPKTYNSLADGAHKFEVRSIDVAGNTDQGPATFSWTIDTTAPTTQIDDSPSALDASGTAEFAFSGTDTGGSGVATFQCRIDSTEAADWQSCTSAKEYTGLADGPHKFEVRSIDTAGNTDTSPATSNWTVDTTAPETQIDSNPVSLSASAKAEFGFGGNDGSGSGVASFQCRIDSTEAADWKACSSVKTYESLTDGSHKFEVRSIDVAGNADQSPATFSWTIDTTVPDTQIDSGPAALVASASAELEFSGTDPGGSGVASYECRIDSIEPSAWTSCTSPKTYNSLADGAHKFEVRAIDTAGNADSSPATYAWTVDTTAPETQIDSNPVSLSASAKADFGFSGNDGSGSGVASFQCRIDSTEAADWQPCASVKTYPALADGAHKFEVRASDQAGNTDQSPATYSWNIDTTAPQTQIDSGPAALVASASAELEFSGTDTGGSGVASYECRIDSTEPSAWTSCTSPKTYNSLADGAHKFEVRAIDTAGNADSSPATYAWTVDTTAPETQIDSNPVSLSASAKAEFGFGGNDGSGSGVASFQCRIDSTEAADWKACSSVKTYESLADGSHKFEVRSIDVAGNADQSPATFSWTIDTTVPDTQIDSGPAALVASASAELEFSGTDPGGSGVASYECRIDSTEPSAWASCTSPKTYNSLADGAHKFEVRASDQAGNADQSPATFSWTIDTTVPDTQIDSNPVSLSASAKAEFGFSGNDGSGSGVASFQCRIDSTEAADWQPCASVKTYPALADGAHKFEVRASDQAGNTDQSPATYSWNIDTTAPQTQIDSGPAALVASASAELEFSGTDTGGSGVASYECRIDSTEPSAWASCTSPKTYNSLADGAHKFEVRAIDTAGNIDTSPAASNWTVDTTAPITQIDSGPSALSASGTANFEFSGTDTGGSGVASYQCRIDSTQGVDWNACTSPKAYNSLADGAHKFEVRAIDTAGNTDQSPAASNWTVDTTAPTTQLDGSPSSLSSSGAAELKFSGTDTGGSGVASYECRIDSTELSAWASCTSPKTYNSLADGAHKFEVRASDQAGNADQSPATFSWTIDTTVPDTQIDSNPVSLSASAKAEFGFSGNDGSGSGVASFQCRIDSTEAADWKACSSVKTYESLADGAHKFEVRAIDTAGNTDQSPATFSWTIDTAPPAVAIDSLSKTLIGAGQSSEVHWHATENGAFELRVGGSDCTSGTVVASGAYGSAPGQHISTVAATDLSEGANALRLCVTDAAGNRGATTASLTRDTTAPETQIDAHPAALSTSSSAQFAFSGTDLGGSGVASYECRRDSTEASAWSSCASPQSYASLTDGAHTFQVRATDVAGNADGSPAAFNWTVDTTPPTATIDSGPSGLTNDATPSFEFHSSEAGSAFECSIDTGTPAYGPCSGPGSHTPAGALADGPHTFRVRATDAAGNLGTAATRAFTVDTTAPPAPELTSTAPPSPANNNSPKVIGSAPAGSTVRLYSGADCSGTPLATVSAAQLAAGITVSVPDDSSTSFHATATTAAENTSGCSAPIAYVEDSSAPQTQIDGHPGALSASATAQFEFSASDGSGSGVASYQCRIDSTQGVDWNACTSPKAYTSLGEGAHKLEVRAIDAAGNTDATPADFEWSIDTAAPQTQIDTHPATLATSAAAQFTFSGTDAGGSGVASYQCRRDSSEASAWVSCTSPQSYATLADGSHSFEVRAIDQAGNADASPAAFSWSIDTTAPQTQVDTHPSSPSNSAAAQFAFSGTDTGGSGVASYECRRDSSQAADWEACSSPKSYASLGEGAHSFEVRAVDVAGNADGSPAAFNWTVDTTPPNTQVDSHPTSLTTATSAQFAFSGTDTGGSGVVAYECRRDSSEQSAWAACASPKNYSALTDGGHKFEVRSVDAAGNADQSPASFDWSIDTTAPETQIDAHPAALSTSSSAQFAFSGTDLGGSGVASYECRRDSTEASAWSSCASPQSYASLTDGAHTFQVRATDVAGNADGSPAAFNWTVDTTPPTATIDSGPSGLTNDATPSFEFHSSEAGSAFECSIDTGTPAYGPCSGPGSHTPAGALADGPHTFRVRATDAAGNLGTAATRAFTVDTTAPPAPELTSTAPPSPANNNSPKVIGSAPAGSTVRLYSGADCSGTPLATVSAAQLAAGITVSVPDDSSTSFHATATTAAENTSGCSAPIAYVEDSSAPQTQIDGHPANPVSSAIATFAFSGTDTGGSGIAGYECRLDSSQAGDWSPCTSPKSYTSLGDGAHTLEVRAVDQAGNADASPAAFSWSIDTTAPQTQIGSGPAALTTATSAQFAFSGTDTGGSGVVAYECRRDSSEQSAWAACASPKNYSALTDGGHKFEVRSVDAAGNADQSPASFDWSIDTTAPETQIDAHPAALSTSSSAQFAFSGTDLGGSGVASYECRRDSTEASAWSSCASPQSYASLTDGAHTFQVRATDVAGNADGSPAAFNWTVDTTPPTATIDSGPSGLTNDATPSFEFHSSEAGSAFECSIDTGTPAYGPCSGPGSHTPAGALADGPHTFRVRATDAAGNLGTAATRAFTVDTTAPPAPELTSTAPPSPANNNSPKVIGSAPAGSTVRLYSGADCSGTPLATVSAAQLAAGITVSVPDDSSTSFHATATTAAENTSGCSAPIAYVEDSSAPQTQIDGHPGALSASATAQFEFSASDGSGSGVASYQCRIDSTQGVDWNACTSPKAYTSLGEGAHKLEVRAIDAAGNTDATPADFEWSIDTAAPQTQIDTHPATLATSAAAQFTFSGTDAGGSGVASYQCRRDSSEASAWVSCTSPQSYATLADGSHSFEVRAIDQAGNADASPAAFSWSIDTTAPQTQVDTHPSSPSNSAAAQFAFSGTDTGGSGVASYECRRDSSQAADWEACSSPKSYASLGEGAHSFQVRATDVAGNADGSPAAFNWTVDTTPPTATIDSGPSGLTNDATPSFEFHSSEAGSAFECSIDTGTPAYGPCSGPGSHTPAGALADGPHTFRVRATDAAGNLGTAASRSFTLDASVPSPPQLSATVPSTPSNDNSPKVVGSAPDGTTVRLYASADCSGGAIAVTGAAGLAAGIAVTVADNSTTRFSATATSPADITSTCSAALTYVEDSSAPQTQIDSGPSNPSASASADFAFSGVDSGGTGIASYQCRLDSTQDADWTPCSSPQSYAGLADGTHGFQVRALDWAGNVDGSPAGYDWNIDTSAPDSESPDTLALRAPVRLLRISYDRRRGTALLIFDVPGPGTLSASVPTASPRKGLSSASRRNAIRRQRSHQIEPKSVRAVRAGRVMLPIRLSRAGRKLLRENGRLRVRMRISFKAKGEATVSRMLAITLKRRDLHRLKRNRHHSRS